jgi:cytochrome c-type biogenesis protein CcmH/NrfG
MKWSTPRLNMRNFSRLAVLAMVAVITLGSLDDSRAKSRPKKTISLDEIQLDDVKSPPRKPSSLDEIQLDEAPVQKHNAPVSPQISEVPDAIRLLLAAADMHEKDKDFAAVISTLHPKIDLLPRSGLLQLGRAYAKQKETVNEIHAIELVTAKNPKDYVALVELGTAYLEVKRYDDAATAFSSAREINGKYRPAYEGAWALLEATQDTAEARTLVSDIIKIFGPDAKSTAALCRMFSGEGFIPERSETACRSAIKFDPKNPENYVYLTMSLRDTDQKESATQAIGDAAKRFPASEHVQTLAGDLKAGEKSFGDSYRYFGQAVKADPKSLKAQLGLAKSAFELQKHGEAIDAFAAACKIDRRSVLEFRQAATTLKRNKDAKWLSYQNAVDDRCD